MKITIITCCYNRVDTLAESLRSAMAQDYGDIEHIIVDGASTDGTLDIIRKAEAEVQTPAFRKAHPGYHLRVISEPDTGMYNALNKGLRAATGDVITWLHSDDTFYDNSTLSAAAEAIEGTGCEFLYANGLYVRADAPEHVVRDWQGGEFAAWKVRQGWLPLHTTCYVRRETVERLGGYDERYRIASDTDWLLRYMRTEGLRVAYLRRYVVRMKMGGLSTNTSSWKKMWHEDVSIFRAQGIRCAQLHKLEKMSWKVPQYVRALFHP